MVYFEVYLDFISSPNRNVLKMLKRSLRAGKWDGGRYTALVAQFFPAVYTNTRLKHFLPTGDRRWGGGGCSFGPHPFAHASAIRMHTTE